MPEARWSDLAVAAAAADKPSSGSADPILTGPQAARRSAHKVHTILFAYPHPWGTPSLALPLLVHPHRTTRSRTVCQKNTHVSCLSHLWQANLT